MLRSVQCYLSKRAMKKKILILSANPQSASELLLSKEVREIEQGLKLAKRRDEFEIISKWAVRPDDLRRALLDNEPEIVHFCGHGTGDRGLVLENDLGEIQLVSAESLADLFQLFDAKIECVVLNACYSEVQAEAIYEHINCVVGMNQEIEDEAAIKFAVGFYDALGAGRGYEDAFKFGRNSIDLAGLGGLSIPILKFRPHPQTKSQAPASTKQIALENPEGEVRLRSAFYIQRPQIEADCYEHIVEPGALIRIRAPRQMGKSSLMRRILNHAKTDRNYRVASLNLQEADAASLNDIDRFLQWFCANLAEELGFPDNFSTQGQGLLGVKRRCIRYFENFLLPNIPEGLVLALDDVDKLAKYPEVAEDFFSLLRAFHEQGKNEAEWEKLRLIIVHSEKVHISNPNQSPFNVGLSIELTEFNELQVRDLVTCHNLSFNDSEIAQLIQLVGGHPYLVRVALYEIARHRTTLVKLIEVAPTQEGAYSEHLRPLENVLKDNSLRMALKQLTATNIPTNIDSDAAFKLHSLGLVKFRGNAVIISCDLYRQYFTNRLKGA